MEVDVLKYKKKKSDYAKKKKNRQFHLYGIISDGTGSFSVQYSNKQNPPKIFDVKFVQRDDETLC